jgi:hypothetical protein
MVTRDLRRDEDRGVASWNSSFGLGIVAPIGPAQPIALHDPKSQMPTARNAERPSHFDHDHFNHELHAESAQAITAPGANDSDAIAGSGITASDVFADGLALNDRAHAGARTRREGDLLGDGESRFCDGCSSISDAFLSDQRFLADQRFVSDQRFGVENVDDLNRSSDSLRSPLLDSAFAIDDRGMTFASSGCSLDTHEACLTGVDSLSTEVPEPGTLSLLGAGLVVFGLMRRRSATTFCRM